MTVRTRYVIEVVGQDEDRLDAFMDLIAGEGSDRRRIAIPDPAGRPAVDIVVGPGIGLRRTVLE